MKKNSINSLKKWVSKIRRYEYEIPRLYEKLEYLEVKSIGYNSPSFDPRISSNGSFSKSSIDYWLEKIDDCEREIEDKKQEIKKYKDFLSSLDELERSLFVDYFYNKIPARVTIAKHMIKRIKFYEIVNKMIQKNVNNLKSNF